jgi:hypothetical protein
VVNDVAAGIEYGAGGKFIVKDVLVGTGLEAIETFDPREGRTKDALCIPATGVFTSVPPETVTAAEVEPAEIADTVTVAPPRIPN